MAVNDSVLAATCAPLKPIDIPLAADDCQLCADVPGTHVAVLTPTVGVAKETSPTSVDPYPEFPLHFQALVWGL